MTEREQLIQQIVAILKQLPADRLRIVYIVTKEIQGSAAGNSEKTGPSH